MLVTLFFFLQASFVLPEVICKLSASCLLVIAFQTNRPFDVVLLGIRTFFDNSAFSRRKVYVLRPFPAGVKNPNGITFVASISFETLVYSCVSTAYAKQKRLCVDLTIRVLVFKGLYFYTHSNARLL